MARNRVRCCHCNGHFLKGKTVPVYGRLLEGKQRICTACLSIPARDRKESCRVLSFGPVNARDGKAAWRYRRPNRRRKTKPLAEMKGHCLARDKRYRAKRKAGVV